MEACLHRHIMGRPVQASTYLLLPTFPRPSESPSVRGDWWSGRRPRHPRQALPSPSAVITTGTRHCRASPPRDPPPMILRRLHLHACASRRSLASAALCRTAPRILPSAGLLRRLHGAAGDGTSSDSEHGRKPGSHLTPPLASVTTIGLLVHGSGPFPC